MWICRKSFCTINKNYSGRCFAPGMRNRAGCFFEVGRNWRRGLPSGQADNIIEKKGDKGGVFSDLTGYSEESGGSV